MSKWIHLYTIRRVVFTALPPSSPPPHKISTVDAVCIGGGRNVKLASWNSHVNSRKSQIHVMYARTHRKHLELVNISSHLFFSLFFWSLGIRAFSQFSFTLYFLMLNARPAIGFVCMPCRDADEGWLVLYDCHILPKGILSYSFSLCISSIATSTLSGC